MIAAFLYGCLSTSFILMGRLHNMVQSEDQPSLAQIPGPTTAGCCPCEQRNNKITRRETKQGVRTRFSISGVPFPLACSMEHALNGTISTAQDASKLTGHLPKIDFSSCTTPTRELDVAFEKMFNKASWSQPPQAFDWCGGMKCQITMGKYTSWASKSLQEYAQYAGSDDPIPRAVKVSPKSEKWARHLDCTTEDAWECMFGRTMPTYEDGTNATRDEYWRASNLWSRRSCLFSDGGCGDQEQYLSNLFHGWTLQWVMPLNACEGFRKRCNNNVMSNINLPKHTTTIRVFLSIHMRMGDACDKVETEQRYRSEKWSNTQSGRPCIAPQGYNKAVKVFADEYGVTDILLGSDSDEAIQWAKEQTLYDVHWLDSDRSRLTNPYSNLSSVGQFVDKHSRGWIENRDDIGWAEVEGALEELDFLAHGQLFIGNMGSHFSRTVYKLMIGRQNVVAPFISVDGWPLGTKWGHTIGL